MSRNRKVQNRAWQRMLSGRRLDLLDPTPVDIEIDDIAHGLAFVARWNGQTYGDYPYSVAEHSLLVEQIYGRTDPGTSPKWRLAALLHDAPEFVIGDMITPVKGVIGPVYAELEDRLASVIHLRFGLPMELPRGIRASIKVADRAAAWLEATQLAGFTQKEADRFFRRTSKSIVNGLKLSPRPPEKVRTEFLKRANFLMDRMT